jgi:hypothetical protein
MMEGPPIASPTQEKPPITDEECMAAMKEGKFDRVGAWYAEQEALVDLDPTPHGRLQLTLRLARLQFESGVIDEDTGESYALATLADAREDAFQRHDDVAVEQIDMIIAEMRAGT